MKECQLCKNCFTDTVATCPNDGMPTVHTISGEPTLEGKYQIECRLGQGGMGVVYKARHVYLKTQLAIKVILPDLVGNDPQLVTRFRQEALAAAAIRHQNVVSVTDYGVIDGTMPYLVMEYVEGESLHDLLAKEKSLSPEKAFELMAAICAGVGAAHHQGIVHRDLKPLNIMICSDKPNMSQAVKILDFGLAKIKSGELLGSFIQAQTTGLMGSPYYMAPEQWADEEPDSRSDIYSLGVMLFQMLAGDVPFKGSSIPAIMKKHISDPAPTFAGVGVNITPELERAVLHTLVKDKTKRTSSVEDLAEELREAVYPGQFIHSATGRSLPVSSLKITTRPPRASIYIDNVPVGQTHEDGQLLLEGIQSGNHHLRVSHSGFHDWMADVVCDGRPQEVFAELHSGDARTAVPRSTSPITPLAMPPQYGQGQDLDQTVQQNYLPSRFDVAVDTIAPAQGPTAQKSRISPLLLGIGGVLALLVIGALGLGAAYFGGLFGGRSGNGGININTAESPSPTPGQKIKPDLIMIPGGTFRMGREDGPEIEGPRHQVTVKSFWMDRTEVTNAEYYAFTTEKGHQPLPEIWNLSIGKPRSGEERMPVRLVNIDDVQAFAAWRSERDGVTYRLPTEQEWEYAARNGSKGNIYPWGDKFRPGCAVLEKSLMDPAEVGTISCPNDWGVMDLIGNVYEWTGSAATPYPGGRRTTAANEPENMVRGGCARNPLTGELGATSTHRLIVPARKRDNQLGFRLVRDN